MSLIIPNINDMFKYKKRKKYKIKMINTYININNKK